MSGAICLTRIPAPRNGGQRLIQRRRAWEFPGPPSSRRRALWVMLGLWLRWRGESTAVDGFEDFVSAASEQCGSGFSAQLLRFIATARVTQNFRPVGVGD